MVKRRSFQTTNLASQVRILPGILPELSAPEDWPGVPLICVVDDRAALLATRQGTDVTGHWGTAPAFVAAARLTIDVLGRSA